MEYCLAAAALNAVDRRSLQRSARLGREVLERAKRRAVDWHSPERSRGCVGVLYGQDPYQERWQREERRPTLSTSFRTMAEFMDYTSSQCGRNCRGETSVGPGSIYQTSEHSQESSWPIENISKDLYIEVYPGTYSVTVGSGALSKKTHVVAVDSGQSVDLVFPV
ncbi:A-kinase-interacting protein 1 isoform X8 [Rattus norvegicus]|uniref:A-kinase-interacting protein 1 isoform X8 n=1 Tax=Rattus norvegicus TaxID=10116 RepID=UPI001916E52B|nr:A-kinase-interacting protein 1 isoform X8 [Rattus norvegicus]